MTTETKVVGGVSLVIVLLIATGVYFSTRTPPSDGASATPTADIATLIDEDSFAVKAENSKVSIVEFTDFQCPYCRSTHPVLRQLLQDHPKEVSLVIRHFPLPQHQFAKLAARSVEAARQQGKFLEMADQIYENQAQWDGQSGALTEAQVETLFVSYAQLIGLDVATFQKDLDKPEITQRIERDLQEASLLGISSTPTLYVNGEKLPNGADLKTTVEERLTEQ